MKPAKAMSATKPDPVFPPLPKGDSMPFYYSSLVCLWVYYRVDLKVLEPYLRNTGLKPAIFEGRGAADISYQNYTAMGNTLMQRTTEIEFNILAYPAQGPAAPEISLAEFVDGQEQTKRIGNFRIHVSCDNPLGVDAGKKVFGEPKFLTTFDYNVPSLNAPDVVTWNIACNDPDTPTQKIFEIKADLQGYQAQRSTISPIVQYSVRDKQVLSCRWDIFDYVSTYILNGKRDPLTLKFGKSSHPMKADMHKIIGNAQAAAIQTFQSQPAAAQPRPFFV